MEKKNSKLVYSTNPEILETQNKDEGENTTVSQLGNQTAYIERDRKQRKGKIVTVISRLSGDLKMLQKELQKECGAGGSFKNGNIEIQGDHRDKVAAILQRKGYKTKYIGG